MENRNPNVYEGVFSKVTFRRVSGMSKDDSRRVESFIVTIFDSNGNEFDVVTITPEELRQWTGFVMTPGSDSLKSVNKKEPLILRVKNSSEEYLY
ncbi:hypothetical protein KC865_00520 [Candidatus Kaiserbacteria bacterium]|nr:hypothetical protein [Candidatus Kaiserbacteria bacterium]USN92710.1 MAG: hypothetical protein H6782_02770 [Candidatus Nomurabacteria bacterium]